ncbi:MAG: amidohydrolase [Spirochaetales bacterium]|nr:amidohydrolase [Spirochaetales bacterium]
MIDIKEEVNRNIDEAVSLALELQSKPELGYKEFYSSSILKRYWESLGLKVEGPFAGTGIRCTIDGAKDGPTLCLMSELDAVLSPMSPMADKSTGAAHACGHNIQSAQVFAAAQAILRFKDSLCGRVVLLAVPAEEFLEIEYRLGLREQGKIRYLSGKPELYRLGVFKDIDMVALIHAHPNTPTYEIYLKGGSLGFTAKNIRFIGKSAHGASPFDGRNALQAANLFLSGVNANRETFKDEDSIRIHPIITKGGDVVNSVPDDVRIETYVRGRSTDAIGYGCKVVDRCANAAAQMMDCRCEIETIPGYLPLKQDEKLSDALAVAAEKVLGKEHIHYGVDMVGSTDIGDLCHLMPALQATLGGFVGEQHGSDFRCVDIKKSCLIGGTILAEFAYSVLSDDAKVGLDVVRSHRRLLSDSEYFAYMDGNRN